MLFEINGCSWYIDEVSQEEIRKEIVKRAKKEMEEEPEKGVYFGITYCDTQVIFLDKSLPEDRKKNTLYHELTHCYINSYITHCEKTYTEEDVCDIMANSHDIIHKIVKDYFMVDNDKK